MSRVTYTCAECGGKNLQLCFPVWVDPNNLDDTSKYDLDYDAQPEKDSDKRYCLDCERSVEFKVQEVKCAKK